MPFTAAHPLAVLPLVFGARRLGLDPTCLVIGAMAPDFEYFARAEPISTLSHTLHGLWLWNLPVTLVLAALLHGVVKWPALLVAPVAITERALRSVGRPWRPRWGAAALVSCAVSALLGAATHLAWDAFTHSDSWGPVHYPVLRTPVTLPVVGPMILHRVLQHASTVLGLIVLGALVARWLARSRPVAVPAVPRAKARCLVAACTIGASAVLLARLASKHATEPGHLIVGTIAGVLAGVIVASLLLASAAQRFERAARGHAAAPHVS